MAYSVKKAGVPFVAKINVNPDITGKAANFTVFYIDDTTKVKTAVTGSFTESLDAPGLYFAPSVSIPAAGDYTFNIVNNIDGLGNISTPVVVVNATLDDVDTAITNLRTVADTIAADVVGLNGTTLDGIRTTLTNIQTLINDTNDVNLVIAGDETLNIAVGNTITGTTTAATGVVNSVTLNTITGNTEVLVRGTTGIFGVGETVSNGTTTTIGAILSVVVNAVNSVMEFVKQLDAAIASGTSGLSALAGYTDDIENMLNGTQFLADGVTANPFYDATNPGVARESTLTGALATLRTDIANAQAAIIAAGDANSSLIQTAVTNVQTVVDSNAAALANTTTGLPALKTLIDTLQTSVNAGDTNILGELGNATYGLPALEAKLVTMDGKLDTIVTAVANIGSANSGVAFV